MDYYVRNFRAVTVILAGLGVGVRTGSGEAAYPYLLFDRVDEPPPAEIESAAWHIGWGCRDVDRCYEEARSKGLAFHTPLTPLGPTFKYAYLIGPDGVLIEINTHQEDVFGHVHLIGADPVAAGQWYVKHLGAQPRPGAPPTFRGLPWATLMVDKVNLIIFPRPMGHGYDDPKYEHLRLVSSRGRVIDHLAFSYADLDPVLERLKKEGVAILERRANPKRAFVEGPDGMRIELVEDAGPNAQIYWCPMDPEVRASAPGRCPICGMTLVPLNPGDYGEYSMDMEILPRALRAGQTGRLRFSIYPPGDGASRRERVHDFLRVHEKLLHLFVVSDDLEYFAHLHPQFDPDGRFVIETAFPRPGPYQLYADFFPAGGTPQVLQKSFVTAGYKGDLFVARARLVPDPALEKTDQGIRVRLEAGPLIAGRKAVLTCRLTDEKTGAPVTDLEPYLGASGHLLALSADLADYAHSHPAVENAANRGPDVVFEVLFPRPSAYRLWVQFQRHGRVATVSFTVSVSRLN